MHPILKDLCCTKTLNPSKSNSHTAKRIFLKISLSEP
jgi:hypothetical protein